jgi:hypothetical protein
VTYDCPLCSTDFEDAKCHDSCPFSSGCAMVRCPRCGYEFVEKSSIVTMIRRVAQTLLSVRPVHESTDKSVCATRKENS